MTVSRPVLTAAGCALFVALLGGAATQIGPWYYGLIKPVWQPPDWLFAPVWTAIYGLTALAGVQVWNRVWDPNKRLTIMGLFALNALLNVLWSELFFGMRRPDWAMSEVIPFWLSILVLLIVVFPISRLGGWALIPYLIWVWFAGFLNLAIVRLNGPFSA